MTALRQAVLKANGNYWPNCHLRYLHQCRRGRLRVEIDICECERVQFAGENFPHEHIGYRLFIDHTHEVLFLAYWKDKDDKLKTPGKRGSVSDEDSSWLRHLKALGQSQGFLTYAQVNERLPLAMVDPEEIDAIVESLKSSGIRVVPDSPTAGT